MEKLREGLIEIALKNGNKKQFLKLTGENWEEEVLRYLGFTEREIKIQEKRFREHQTDEPIEEIPEVEGSEQEDVVLDFLLEKPQYHKYGKDVWDVVRKYLALGISPKLIELSLVKETKDEELGKTFYSFINKN